MPNQLKLNMKSANTDPGTARLRAVPDKGHGGISMSIQDEPVELCADVVFRNAAMVDYVE